jgi:hypothetical protein
VRRGCITPLVVKAIGGLSLMPSDTGVMPQKIHPNIGIRDSREPLKSKGFEVVRGIYTYSIALRKSRFYTSSV